MSKMSNDVIPSKGAVITLHVALEVQYFATGHSDTTRRRLPATIGICCTPKS